MPDPSKVLIIHPGSRYLRFGRATDTIPYEVPNCIARKTRTPASHQNGHSSGQAAPTFRVRDMDDEKLEILKLDLRARMRIMKLRGTSGGSIAASEYNATVVAEDVPAEVDEAPITWSEESGTDKEVYFGDEALHLPEPEKHGWAVKWPYIKGRFNTQMYASSRELLGDIMDIWLHALEEHCGVKANELKEYNVILLIQDLYDHLYIQEMSDLVLRTMGFAQLIIHQASLPNY